jgi:RsiW-degrading membrane proteinase PrsW (M82 family)
MYKFYLFAGAAIIAIILVVNIFFEKPFFKKYIPPLINTEFKITSYDESVDTLSLDYHFKKIREHYRKPVYQKGLIDMVFRDDEQVEKYYKQYVYFNDSATVDLGNFGLGMYFSQLKNYKIARSYFNEIKNKNIKYLNNELGFISLQTGMFEEAEKYFNKEIEMKGNVTGAYRNLVLTLYNKKDFKQLEGIYEKHPEFFPVYIESDLNFVTGKFLPYFKELFNINTTRLAFAGAFFIMLSWLFYLVQLNIFKKARWRYLIITLLSGIFFTYFTGVIYDFARIFLKFDLNGGLANDFIYCIAGIGAIEEWIKIIPFLCLLFFTKAIQEPIDYIIYASVSALGFAFAENLHYFKEYEIDIIHGRAFISVLSHMIDTSIIAYGLMVARYRGGSYVKYFAISFVLASLSHGFFDFWLLNETVRKSFYLLTDVWMLLSVLLWITFINNALNNSPIFRADTEFKFEKIRNYVFSSLMGVLMFEYVATAMNSGSSVANDALIGTMLTAALLIIFITAHLSNLDLIKDYWAPLYLYEFFGKRKYLQYLNREIVIESSVNSKLQGSVPIQGKILYRKYFSESVDYFVVKLLQPLSAGSGQVQYALIRAKSKKDLLNFGKKSSFNFYSYDPENNDDSLSIRYIDSVNLKVK